MASLRPTTNPGKMCMPRRQRVVARSVDPLANRTKYETGCTMPIHSVKQLDEFKGRPDQLVVVMCKSSHCRPCKKFASTYHDLAERFPDCILLEVMGDETPELRKLMMNLQVKSTPTFFLYRDAELLETVTGTSNDKLLNAILRHLKPGERGYDWVEVTHMSIADFEELPSPSSSDERA